jgi:hypothetical protein
MLNPEPDSGGGAMPWEGDRFTPATAQPEVAPSAMSWRKTVSGVTRRGASSGPRRPTASNSTPTGAMLCQKVYEYWQAAGRVSWPQEVAVVRADRRANPPCGQRGEKISPCPRIWHQSGNVLPILAAIEAGKCKGSKRARVILPCRPPPGEISVMVFADDDFGSFAIYCTRL